MANIFRKHLHHCFSSLKCLPAITPSPSSSSKQDQNQSSPTNNSLLFNNFNSLYDLSSEISTSKSLTTSSDDYLSSSTCSDSDSDAISPPDFATIFASQRFFLSSPGRSNSIIESPDSTRPEPQETSLNGSVAFKKYSPDPYSDFRCSMQEMIEARNLRDVMDDRDFLHELLICYLTLNPKHAHKFIIRAFADILISLLLSQDSDNRREFEGHRR